MKVDQGLCCPFCRAKISNGYMGWTCPDCGKSLLAWDWDKQAEWVDDDSLLSMRNLADSGEPVSQCNLGALYDIGSIFSKSDELMLHYIRESAEQGYAPAQNYLGWMYSEGQGVEQSDEEAIKWYAKSANQGYKEALDNIDILYWDGPCYYQSDAEWYRMFAEVGIANAQYNLGRIYSYGQGVELSYEEAVKWYRLSADQGYAPAQCNLGVMYDYGRGVKQSYEEAVKWYRLAADQGNARAQCNLGVMYEYGRGVEQSYEEALSWYLKAAKNGDKGAADKVTALSRIVLERKKGGGPPRHSNQIIDRHMETLEKAGYMELFKDESEAAPEDEVFPNPSTPNDETDEWSIFGKALSREQSAYLRKKMESVAVKRDFDMEERINMLSNETIGDSVLDNGEIVEDYLEDLERLFDE